MNYGDILTDTLRIIWREKKLWVISAVGVLVFSFATMIYAGVAMGWQVNWMSNLMMMDAGMTENDIIDWLTRFSLGYLAMMGFMGLFGLVGYVINLIARAGVVAEAARAIRGEKTDISRGLGRGVHKAAAYFALDLLWSLPWIMAGLFVMFLALILAGGMFEAMRSGWPADDDGAVFGLVSGIFAMMGLLTCLALIIALFRGVFAPLMYQASVIDDMPLGEAIREGWRLAKENIGPMVVFLLLIWVVLIAIAILFRILATPFSFMLMGPWFGVLRGFEEGATPSGPAAWNWGLMVIGVIGMGALTWLWKSLAQTVYLVYYARVYEALREGNSAFVEMEANQEASMPAAQ